MATAPTQLVPSFLFHKPGRRAELSSSQKLHGRYSTRTCDSLSLRDGLTARGATKRMLQIVSATATDQEEKDRVLQTLVRGMDQVVLILEGLDSILSETKPNVAYSAEDLKQAASESVKKHLEQLDTDFLKALDFDIAQAQKAEDNMKCSVLELVKEEVLDQLTHKFPPQVRVVSLLVTVGCKEQRREVLCRAAGGGGEVDMEGGGKLSVPGATFDMIREQLEDLIANLEEKPCVRERRLLAQMVVVREEVRELMAGGVEDPRNQLLKLTNIPNSHVEFMERVVPLQGEALRQRLSVVFLGEMEGADPPEEEGGASADVEMIETYYSAKELEGGIYKMQLIRRETLHVLRVLGFGAQDKQK